MEGRSMNRVQYRQVPDTQIERDATQLVLEVADGKWLVLRGTAMDVWDYLSNPRSIDDVTLEMTRRYSGDPNEVRRDVEKVVRHLVNAQVVQSANVAS